VSTALDAINSRPARKDTYAALVQVLDRLGPYEVQNKKTSLHIAHRRAFLGVHPRATGLLLTIVTTTALDSTRIRKREQVSANRCHNEVLLTGAGDVDDELTGWITQAYALTTT
jgi:hypothetical protein